MPPFIQSRNISVVFKPKNREAVTALNDFNLEVAKGEFVSIVGPSGCGKSTFLNILLGLIKPNTGEMQLNGTPITGPSQERAMVFQEFGLLPWRTVAANVELGLELKGIAAAQRAERASELIKLVGLSGFQNHYPHELSGGMKQRVGLARALATEPDVLLMDEPFADSIEEAAYLSDRVIIMTARPGRTKELLKIHLARPRDYEMRLTPEFNDIKAMIWNTLKDELTARSEYGA